jgi:putative NADH-flavin reductase
MQDEMVTVLARDPSTLGKKDARLEVIRGDITDRGTVNSAEEGQHAVVITIGRGPTNKPVSLFSEGPQKVVTAIAHHSVDKLICVTGIGAGDSKGHGGFLYDTIFNPLLLKTIYEDKNIQEKSVQDSKLEWLIVRPGFLTNGALTGKYLQSGVDLRIVDAYAARKQVGATKWASPLRSLPRI